MKTFIVALVFAGLSAAAVSVLLNKFQEPGYVCVRNKWSSCRRSGHNLVGANWSGENSLKKS